MVVAPVVVILWRAARMPLVVPVAVARVPLVGRRVALRVDQMAQGAAPMMPLHAHDVRIRPVVRVVPLMARHPVRGGVTTVMISARVVTVRGLVAPVLVRAMVSRVRLVLTKTSLTNKAKRVHVPLGTYTFKETGREVTLPVTAFDGTPGIQVVIDGTRMWQPLERVQTKRRGTTLYGNWRIPEDEAVSPHLRGMTAWIRQSSTEDERATGKRRTRALRTIPPTDSDWRRLFGGREDTESMHNHMKEKWFGRRVRAVGLERRELQLRGYQIHQGITALLAWHYRTGGDLSRYFGEWEPPIRGSASRT